MHGRLDKQNLSSRPEEKFQYVISFKKHHHFSNLW